METTIQDAAQHWAKSPIFDQATRQEIQTLLDQQDEKELADRFIAPLEFGTGGMRGIMGAGTNRMNRYVVRQATEGLARYIEKNPQPGYSGVVIGYDSRHNSPEFAQAASEVLAGHGIPVFLFESLAPTPLISFEVLQQKAVAGIMITASHNPSEYNGYKVYWKNGGQVIPPDDEGIISEVRQVTDLGSIPEVDFKTALNEGKVQWMTVDSDARYLQALEDLSLGDPSLNANVGVVYSPLHGTGARSVPAILAKRGFQKFTVVTEQMEPDSNFSTVRSPNPEDTSAFARSQEVASADDELIMTNDPDADRLGVMVRHDGNWHRLNGNQAGALLLDYYLSQLKAANRLPSDGIYLLSIVSSPLGKKIASSYGLKVIETLTGFKWIRAEGHRMEEEGTGTFVFGMEESLGYLAGTHSGDKDGVWAAMAFAEMVALLKSQGNSPMGRLEQLQQEHGYHLDDLENIVLPGLEGRAQINQQMNGFRENPPTEVGGSALLRVIDLGNDRTITPGQSESTPGPGLPKSNVLIFELENQARIIVRPSGTEPKIKYYFNLSGPSMETLEHQLADIKKDLLG